MCSKTQRFKLKHKTYVSKLQKNEYLLIIIKVLRYNNKDTEHNIFFTILRHKLIADRVGSSHYDFDPEDYKARFQAEKGNLKFKFQSRFN